MKAVKIEPHLSDEEILTGCKGAKEAKEARRWQALYLFKVKKMKAMEISHIVDASEKTVYAWLGKYNKFGPGALKTKVRSSRPGALMTMEDEAALLRDIEDQASRGLVATAKAVKLKAEAKLERSVCKDYPYDLLHRHGWRKLAPRPENPGGDEEKREEFKKNFPIWSKKPQRVSVLPTEDR